MSNGTYLIPIMNEEENETNKQTLYKIIDSELEK